MDSYKCISPTLHIVGSTETGFNFDSSHAPENGEEEEEAARESWLLSTTTKKEEEGENFSLFSVSFLVLRFVYFAPSFLFKSWVGLNH